MIVLKRIKINNIKKYSIYIYFINNKYKKIININKWNNIIYIKNNKIIFNILDTMQNWIELQKKKEYLKWLRRWHYENVIIFNMHKKFTMFKKIYQKIFFKYYKFLKKKKYLKNIFLNIIKYEFRLTTSMLMKAILWTSPNIYWYWDTKPLIELRSLEIRIRRLKMSRKMRWRWKIYRLKKRRVIIEKLPRMSRLRPIYWLEKID